MREIHYENGKNSEKKWELTHEMFDSMKTIKLYGWDGYFHDEIKKYTLKEKENEKRTDRMYRLMHFMWDFFPSMIGPVTFVIFMARGHTISFSDMMEVIMLLGMV